MKSPNFPIDRTVIRTDVRLAPEIGEHVSLDPKSLPPRYRHLVCKMSRSVLRRRGDDITSLALQVGSYQGIGLYAELRGGNWRILRIDFNPGVVLSGHNGAIVTHSQFLRALSILLEMVTPLLAFPGDEIHLVPGVHGSRAYWGYVEIFQHIPDPDGRLLRAFESAGHVAVRKSPITCPGESVRLGSAHGQLSINIYRKDIELISRYKPEKLAVISPILRVEFALRGELLIQSFGREGGGNLRTICDKVRLVRFDSRDIRRVFLELAGGIKGVFIASGSAEDPCDDKAGRMMAWMALNSSVGLNAQLRYYEERFKTSKPTIARLKKAAHDELARLNKIQLSELFSEDCWRSQFSFSVPHIERIASACHRNIDLHHKVAAAYDSPGVPEEAGHFVPHISL